MKVFRRRQDCLLSVFILLILGVNMTKLRKQIARRLAIVIVDHLLALNGYRNR